MKIEAPKEFLDWFEDYKHTANYFMAHVEGNKDQLHALFLCLRDSFIKGQQVVPMGTDK
jgi:hypothetical protein